MLIRQVERSGRGFVLSWSDQSVSDVPFIWLRDNDPQELHADTGERLFDLTSIALDIQPLHHSFSGEALTVHWPDKTVPSVYSAQWLCAHRPGHVRADSASVARQLWTSDSLGDIPRVDGLACSRSPEALKQALLTVKRLGLVIFTGLGTDTDAADTIADLIGFRRQTNFGLSFDVISKPDPNNLAYTALALPLHTDLPNQELVPGYQCFLGLRNSTSGGASLYADGFRISADFAAEQAEMFELLKRVAIPWRFHDATADIRRHRPIIAQAADGEFEHFVFNAHIADVPDLSSDLLYDFYAAYRELMLRVRDPKYALRQVIQPGDMVMLDNRRVLHGREAFDPGSGARHLYGFYLEHNEVDSCIRVLSR